jgi:hypothetical protein
MTAWRVTAAARIATRLRLLRPLLRVFTILAAIFARRRPGTATPLVFAVVDVHHVAPLARQARSNIKSTKRNRLQASIRTYERRVSRSAIRRRCGRACVIWTTLREMARTAGVSDKPGPNGARVVSEKVVLSPTAVHVKKMNFSRRHSVDLDNWTTQQRNIYAHHIIVGYLRRRSQVDRN